jgi:hypothetical protein
LYVAVVSKIFGSAGNKPADLPRLSAVSECRLSLSLQRLPPGGAGWISISEAAHVFSTMESEYAFGEMDKNGQRRLAEFAAACRCEPQFMPTEGRVYFQRSRYSNRD